MKNKDIVDKIIEYTFPLVTMGGGTLILHDIATNSTLQINEVLGGLVLGLILLSIGITDIFTYRAKLSKAETRKTNLSHKVDELKNYKRVVEALPTESVDVDLLVQKDGEEVEMKVKNQ